jgi:hypothetical protein
MITSTILYLPQKSEYAYLKNSLKKDMILGTRSVIVTNLVESATLRLLYVKIQHARHVRTCTFRKSGVIKSLLTFEGVSAYKISCSHVDC